jgi:membrane protein YqaA with SNARE-associated domain
MGRFVAGIQSVALSLGAPGLFLIAFLDSSFLSLPEINDLLLVWMVSRHESRMVLYAASATLGSISGCLVLYYIGRKGDQFVVRRFSPRRIQRALAQFQRYGVLAVLIPSLLPPPAPFKIFVLLSGVAGIKPSRFVLAIAAGRGARYFIEGLLAVWYGDQAIDFIRANGRTVTLVIVALLAAGLATYLVWKRTRRPETPIE